MYLKKSTHGAAPALYSGLGAIEASGWTTSGGVARAKNSQVMAVFKDLQVQANRLAAVFGLTRIVVDGAIGPATMNLVKAVGDRLFYTPTQVMRSVDDVAASADVTADVFKGRADNMGAPISAGTPTPGPATGGSTGISLPSSFPSSFPGTPAQPPVAPPSPPSASIFGSGPGILPEALTAGFPGGEMGVLAAVGFIGILYFTRKKRGRKGARAMKRPWRGAKSRKR